VSNGNRSLSPTAPSSLAAVAAQLRDGPLERCVALHRQATALANEMCAGEEDLSGLVEILDLTREASEQFHAFHRDLRALVSKLAETELVDIHRASAYPSRASRRNSRRVRQSQPH
jgi:hypothetical protein